jgi:hypothetical protein
LEPSIKPAALLLYLLWMVLMASPALAEATKRYVIRDGDGRRTSTVEKGLGDRDVIRDK